MDMPMNPPKFTGKPIKIEAMNTFWPFLANVAHPVTRNVWLSSRSGSVWSLEKYLAFRILTPKLQA